jgi:hypothetical protein
MSFASGGTNRAQFVRDGKVAVMKLRFSDLTEVELEHPRHRRSPSPVSPVALTGPAFAFAGSSCRRMPRSCFWTGFYADKVVTPRIAVREVGR